MRNKLFILLLISLSIFPIYAQEVSDVKNQKIEIDNLHGDNIDSIISKVYTFVGDDFDSLDIQLLSHGPILGTIIVNLITNETDVTYGDLYQKFLDIKRTPQFAEIRTKQVITNTLMSRPADFNHWEEDKALFMQLGFEGELLERLQLYLEENSSPDLTYETVLVGFRDTIENAEERNAKKPQLAALLESSVLFDETQTLYQSQKENKPILLYFTGYGCVNCRKIEQAVLFNPRVSESIIQNFVFKPIYIDDNHELPKPDQIEVKFGEKTKQLKTIGDRHFYYQLSRFNVSGQPYFVVLNGQNEIIATADYSANTLNKFLDFLSESLNKSQ